MSASIGSKRRSIAMVAAMASVLLTVACDGDSPTAPASAQQMRLTQAQVVVDGVVMNGQTLHHGQQLGPGTLFQAWLMGPDEPLPGQTVRVQYRRPGTMGPMGMTGFLELWDDGTHGDPVAGDGIYCYWDEDGSFGFHTPHHPPGEYHYEFYGIDHAGHHSNHREVLVTLVGS